MEEQSEVPQFKKGKRRHPIVIVERGWKEYVGECLLIVFSVILALGLTEYFTRIHEKNKINEILHQLREELTDNKNAAAEQYNYHMQVFALIDSAKRDMNFAKKFLDNGVLHFNVIMPKGALLNDLNEVAWQQAKQNNVFAYIDISTYSLLTDVYNNQERFLNLEPGLANLLISFEARKPENLNITLTLVHDLLFAWIVERTPQLIKKYQEAINKLSAY